MYPTDNFPFDKVAGGKEYPWARGEYEVLFYEYDDRIIWGLTAKILYYNLKMIQSYRFVLNLYYWINWHLQ